MFTIIYDTLARPSRIASHVDEKPFRKFLEFIVVMLLLALAPVIFAQAKSITFSNYETKQIINAINHEAPLQYQIKDGKMVYTGEGENKDRSFKFEANTFNMSAYPVYIIFSLDGTGYQVNTEAAHMVILKENEIEIRYCPEAYKASNSNGATLLAGLSSMFKEKEEVVKTIKYDKLNINFDKTVISEKKLFSDIYTVGNTIYGKLKWGLIFNSVALSISYIAGSFISTIAISILLMFLLFKFFGVRFRKVIKIALLCCTPYVVFNLIAYLYDNSIFVYAGEILTIFYIYKSMRTYALINMMNQHGGSL